MVLQELLDCTYSANPELAIYAVKEKLLMLVQDKGHVASNTDTVYERQAFLQVYKDCCKSDFADERADVTNFIQLLIFYTKFLTFFTIKHFFTKSNCKNEYKMFSVLLRLI